MKKLSRTMTFAIAAFAIASAASAATPFQATAKTVGTMMGDMAIPGLQVDVISMTSAESHDTVKAVNGTKPVSFETGAVIAAVYRDGICAVVVNDKTAKRVAADLDNDDVNKDDVLFYMAAHAMGHCVAQHRQAQTAVTATAQSNEAFADAFAVMYNRSKKGNTKALVPVMAEIRGESVSNAMQVALAQPSAVPPAKVVSFVSSLNL
jgi:hypothetical protein